MGKQLPPMEMELYRAIDEVLHYLWDPIGISDYPSARDEYYSYLPDVYKLVLNGANEEQIANHLGVIATERMGLRENRHHDLDVSKILLSWREFVKSKYDEQSGFVEVPN